MKTTAKKASAIISFLLVVFLACVRATPIVEFTQDAISVSQKAGTVNIPIQTTGNFDTTYWGDFLQPSVAYYTQGATAKAYIDYEGISFDEYDTREYFTTENSTNYIPVKIYYTGSTVDKEFTLSIADSEYSNLGKITSARIKILAEPYVPPIEIQLGKTSISAKQSVRRIQIPVTYTGTAKNSDVWFDYKTEDGTAKNSIAYEGTSSSRVYFPPGSKSALIDIPINITGSPLDKFFRVVLLASSEGNVVAPIVSRITILKAPPVPKIRIITKSGYGNNPILISGRVYNTPASDIRFVKLTISGATFAAKGRDKWSTRLKFPATGEWTIIARAYLKNGKVLVTVGKLIVI